MTLVMAACVGGSFCITTGDTRTVYHSATYDDMGNIEIEDEILEKTDDATKVWFLSEYVMFCAAGKSDIINHIRKELQKRISSKDPLLQCSTILQDIIEEMRKEKKSPFYFHFLNEDEHFAIVLNGFEYNGTCGFAYFISGQDNETQIRYTKKGEYDYIMLAPSEDYNNKKDEFLAAKVQANKKGLKETLNRMIKVHTVISFLQPDEVSRVCDYKILEWKKKYNRAKSKQGSKNVETFYKKMNLI